MSEELLVFRKFRLDTDAETLELHRAAASEKLHTLFPGNRITATDATTFCIATDSPYSTTGYDLYDLGLVDGEVAAMRNQRTDEVITFRV